MDVYLVGIGMTKFGPLPDKSVKDIAGNAVNAALSDAGIGIGDIESRLFRQRDPGRPRRTIHDPGPSCAAVNRAPGRAGGECRERLRKCLHRLLSPARISDQATVPSRWL